MALEGFEVIPQGRIMFLSAFVVKASRGQQAKVADDTRLQPQHAQALNSGIEDVGASV